MERPADCRWANLFSGHATDLLPLVAGQTRHKVTPLHSISMQASHAFPLHGLPQ